MPIEVVMPKLGLTMASGTIARWIKRPGEAVREGEPLVEVATDKIAYEVEAPATGTLARALGADGDEFACGDVIGTIALAGETDTPVPAPTGTSTAPDAVTTDGAARIVEAPRISGAANGVAPTAGSSTTPLPAERGNGERVIASPAARRLARERGISLRGVRGTGPRGRITMSDVITLRQAQGDIVAGHDSSDGRREQYAPVGAPAMSPRDEVTLSLSKGEMPSRLPRSRRAIYRKMTEVGFLPLAQVETVARADALKALIDRRRDFGWTAFAVYAVARLLREHADLRTDATTGAPFERIDVGVAADTPHGLIVPVVRDADTRSLAEIQREIVRLAGLAREGALAPDDIGGACFSISNVGPQGVERVAPLPDSPQTAILGIGAATQRPAVVDPSTGSGQAALTAAWMLTCVVSFDHRFVDGAPAARFLAAFAAACADPGMLL
ncbi:MAG TPA: dihydrolipoamide acetyltransferase family protein [Candidatus Limnocylindrales bacterium]|nr:dihydrolipoamide acetyltransferase family protein [Candidatus Limnocylindrales bacterium]